MSSTMNQIAIAASTQEDTASSPQHSATNGTRIYRGRSVEELIPRIQAELGGDAIVVRQNKGLTGGVGGFFQRPFVEIEARRGHPGVDLYDEPDAAPAMPPSASAPATPRATSPLVYGQGGMILADASAEPAPEPLLGQAPRNCAHAVELEEIDDQFAAVLAETEAAAIETQPLDGLDDAFELPADTPVERRQLGVAPAPSARARKNIERSLLGVGFSEELVEELVASAAAHALPLMASRPGLARSVRAALLKRIPSLPTLPAAGATVAFVGPGGSGRTSCCAAILKAYRQRSTLPVACATVVAQDGTGGYSMLLSPDIREPTPLNAPHLARSLRRARGEGLLLLDTPPASPADAGAIRALAALLDRLKPDRVVVALPATLGEAAATQLLQALRPLKAQALAITHADETDQLGVAVQAACRFGLAPEYLLDRGRGGKGLTLIDPTQLADKLLP